MTFFRKRQEPFSENIFLRMSLILVYGLFLGIYFLNHEVHEDEILSFLQIHKNEGSFFIELFENINWFLFYFIGMLLPLDYFQNMLFEQHIFETIRKNNKSQIFMEFFFSIGAYSSLFVGLNMMINLLVGNKELSVYLLGLIFFVLILTISLLLLVQIAISFFIEGYTGTFISLGVVLICFYYDKVALFIPTQLFEQAVVEKVILINSVLAVALLWVIKVLHTRKELI